MASFATRCIFPRAPAELLLSSGKTRIRQDHATIIPSHPPHHPVVKQTQFLDGVFVPSSTFTTTKTHVPLSILSHALHILPYKRAKISMERVCALRSKADLTCRVLLHQPYAVLASLLSEAHGLSSIPGQKLAVPSPFANSYQTYTYQR